MAGVYSFQAGGNADGLFLVINGVERHGAAIEHEVEVSATGTPGAVIGHLRGDLKFVQT